MTVDRAPLDSATRASMTRSLRWLSAWWTLRWSWLGESVWVIYLLEIRGLTLGQVLAFEAAFQAVVLVAQVPTGILADRYGRRPMLIGGSASWAVAFVSFGLAENVLALLGSYLWFALGMALMSGADDAMLFDTLRTLGRGEEFARRSGRLNSFSTLAASGFTLLGSLMVRWTPLAWPMVASGAIGLAAAACAWPVREPPRPPERRSFRATGASALGRAWRRPALRWLIAIVALSQVGIEVVHVVFQPVLVDAGAPIWSLGLFGAALTLAAAAGGWTASAIESRAGFARTLGWLAPLAALGLLGAAGGSVWLFPALLLPSFGWNALYPLVADYLSRRVPDDERATTLSISQMVAQIGGIAATLAIGVATDRGGREPALAGAGAVLLVTVLTAIWLWNRAGERSLEVHAGAVRDVRAIEPAD